MALEFSSRPSAAQWREVARDIVMRAQSGIAGCCSTPIIFTAVERCGRGFEDVPADRSSHSSSVTCRRGRPPRAGLRSIACRRGKAPCDWREVFQLLLDKGYAGYINYEAPNPAQWVRPPDDVALEGIEREDSRAHRGRT